MSVPNKCASQFLNQFAFKILGLKDSDLQRGTSMYSYRSSVRFKELFSLWCITDAATIISIGSFSADKLLVANSRFSTTMMNQNILPEQKLKQKLFDIKQKRHVCLKGEKVLFVRHPILRLISAWNDKFSLRNNNVKSGLEYGVRLLRGWKNSFPDDHGFLVKTGLSKLIRKMIL